MENQPLSFSLQGLSSEKESQGSSWMGQLQEWQLLQE